MNSVFDGEAVDPGNQKDTTYGNASCVLGSKSWEECLVSFS